MTTVDIRPLDLDDPAMVDEWFGVRLAAFTADRPDDLKPSLGRIVDRVRKPKPGFESEEWLGLVDGRVVASTGIGITTLDNLHSAHLNGWVHPDFRRRGIGRALWLHALDRVHAKDRAKANAVAVRAVDGGPPRDGAGVAFLTAMGMSPKLAMTRRHLDLSTVDEKATSERLAVAWSHADGYALRVWVNHTPPDLIDDIAYLDSRLLMDAPTGDLDIEPFKVDAERVRGQEATAAARLVTSTHAAVVHTASGRVAAWSCMSHELEHHGQTGQGVTIVDPGHRGHRLGTVVKLELQRYATAVTPSLRTVETFNADSNAHMIRINDLVGFRPVDAQLNFQAELADLRTTGVQA